jgi:hypothetical protein
MGARLGVMPEEWKKLTPAEQKQMWDGWRWRRSRDMEVLASTILWMIGPHVKAGSVDFDDVSRTFPGYDREFQRRVGIKEGED